MMISPTPFFARGPVYHGPFRDIAVTKSVTISGGVAVSSLNFRVSADGRRFHAVPPGGDLANALRSDGPYGAAFEPVAMVPFKGVMLLAGNMRTAAGGYSAAVFATRDGRSFTRQTLTNTAIGVAPNVVGIAANDDYVAMVSANGVLHYSATGISSWVSRTDLPAGAIGATSSRHIRAIGASSGGFVVAGSYTNSDGTPGSSIALTASTPAATFASRSIPSMYTLETVGRGNVMLIASGQAGGLTRIAYASLTDLTTWASAGFTDSQFIAWLVYKTGSKWIGGSGYNKNWNASTTGSSGWSVVTDPAKKPWPVGVVAEHPYVNAAYAADGKFHVHWGYYGGATEGGTGISTDGDTWEHLTPAMTGLANLPYIIGTKAAA